MQSETRRRPGGRIATLTVLLVVIVLGMLLLWYIGGQKTVSPEPLAPVIVTTPVR